MVVRKGPPGVRFLCAADTAGRRVMTFAVLPEVSALVVEARSTAGPIAFGATGVQGTLEGVLDDSGIDVASPTTAEISVSVASLTSGNALYDAELRDRLEARRYPLITARLRTISALTDNRFAVAGELTIHGTTREQAGTVDIGVSAGAAPSGETPVTVVASGTQIVDIRDFNIVVPSVLMLQIYPDVTVRYRIAATSDERVEPS